MIVCSDFYKKLLWLSKFCQKGSPYQPYRTVQIQPLSDTDYCLSIFDGAVQVSVWGACLNAHQVLTFDLYDLLKAAKPADKDAQIVLLPGLVNGGSVSSGEAPFVEDTEYFQTQEVDLDFSWLSAAADNGESWSGVWLRQGAAYGASRTRFHVQKYEGNFNFCIDARVAKNLPPGRMLVKEGNDWCSFFSPGWSVKTKVRRVWEEKIDRLANQTSGWERRRVSASRLRTVLKDSFFNDYVNLLIYENLSVECNGKMLVVDLEERGEFKGQFQRKMLLDALGSCAGKVFLRYSDIPLLRIDHDGVENKFAVLAGLEVS